MTAMRPQLRHLSSLILLLLLLDAVPARAKEEPFSFVVLGDTAYNLPVDLPVYTALIRRINASRPAFTIHVGDIWGEGSCGDAAQQRVLGFFQQYDHPLIYTPGDNDWTDCWQAAAGGFDPLERLGGLRRTFFSRPTSLGERTIPLLRQGDVPAYAPFVENARWEKGGVVFATVHIVGSMNNSMRQDQAAVLEYLQRNAADVAWIDAAFAAAKKGGARALVLALHAEIFALKAVQWGPYRLVIEAIKRGSEGFPGPVLVVHGDGHIFTIDRPLLERSGEEHPPRYDRIIRLQVFGAPELKAVRVTVEPETPGVFGFTPLY
jgi:hypothetical protein